MTRGFLEFLRRPAVDRIIGIAAVLPFVYPVYLDFKVHTPDFPTLAAIANGLILVSTMFTRRAPIRITGNIWYWLLAIVATYGSFLPFAVREIGYALASPSVTAIISTVSLVVTLWARLSLGRNIGFVPAERRLVMTGAYRFVRHPIYAGLFLGYLSAVLEYYSARFALSAAGICILFVVKSLIEERFLSEDPNYAAYMERVRYRWIPGVI